MTRDDSEMALNELRISALLEYIDDIVRCPGHWRDKREHIRGACTPHERTSLEEFVSWFELESHS